MEQLTSIVYSIVGFIIGSLIIMGIGITVSKYAVKRIVKEVVSDETKRKITKWLEEGIRNGIGSALQDEEVRDLIIRILELSEKRLKIEGKNVEKKRGGVVKSEERFYI